MELHVVVITFATEVDESLASFGNDVCVEFQIDHSKIGHKPHVTFLLHPGKPDLVRLFDGFRRL